MNIKFLKTINFDNLLEVDELVAVSAEIRNLEAEFELLELEVPEWLSNAGILVRKEISNRVEAAELAQIKDLQNQLESFKTQGEKKADVQKKLAALQRKHGLAAKGGK